MRCRIHLQYLRAFTHPSETSYRRLLEEGEEAVATFAGSGDDVGLAAAWNLIATAHYFWSHHGARLQASEEALKHAMRAGDLALASDCVGRIAFAMLHGPTPAGTAVRRSEDLLARFSGRPRFELVVTTPMSASLAMLGRFREARDVAAWAMAVAEDLGWKWSFALAAWMAGDVERLAGRRPEAEHRYEHIAIGIDAVGLLGDVDGFPLARLSGLFGCAPPREHLGPKTPPQHLRHGVLRRGRL